jgi:hypothetical protein
MFVVVNIDKTYSNKSITICICGLNLIYRSSIIVANLLQKLIVITYSELFDCSIRRN